jgi:type VI secretion system secreted protein Hcp
MAVDMFIELTGISGDSKIKANAIDIESWSFGATQQAQAHRSTGLGAGKVNVQDVHVMKIADKTSPTLLLKCCKGEHIAKAKITCRKAGGDAPVDYFTLEMEDVIITSVQNTGSNGNDLVTESLTLSFGAFKQIFTEQQTKGGGKGGSPECGWSIVENKAK